MKLDLADEIGEGNVDAPEFFRQVYRVVARIPRGRVSSYGDVAEGAGRPGAHRAVGTAMSLNQGGDRVPCHRVVRADGTVGGYGSDGVALKIRRLADEGVEVDPETLRIRDFGRLRFARFPEP